MTFKEEQIKELIECMCILKPFKWRPNPPIYCNQPIKVRIGLDEDEQRLVDKTKLDTIENIDRLLNHKVINVNKEELSSILERKSFFEHNNTLCVQIDSNGTYWIKFDNKGAK